MIVILPTPDYLTKKRITASIIDEFLSKTDWMETLPSMDSYVTR